MELPTKVSVLLIGVLQDLAGRARISLEFDGDLVRDAIWELAELLSPKFRHSLIDPELDDPRPNLLVLLNGKEISVLNGLETRVKNGDELALVPVAHGGRS
ncbi:MAG: MoaD/ThiS family protein [Candidatus Bathyarchaeota archaeon]|nr:MAG: MoaD/ThiS family protein [Candidatus Bathyarchaeota archaeon]